jgi:hypothetical protein
VATNKVRRKSGYFLKKPVPLTVIVVRLRDILVKDRQRTRRLTNLVPVLSKLPKLNRPVGFSFWQLGIFAVQAPLQSLTLYETQGSIDTVLQDIAKSTPGA